MTRHPIRTPALAVAIAAALAAASCGGQPWETAAPAAPAAPAAEAPASPPAAAEPAAAPDRPGIEAAEGTVEATEDNVQQAFAGLEAAAAAMRAQWQDKSFEEFEAETFREPIEGGKYIVNGDIAIADRKHLREFYLQVREELSDTAGGKLVVNRIGVGLVVNQVNGRDDVWTSARRRQLAYCVDTGFGARHAAVLADMTAATVAWEEAADVDFVHVAAEDASCDASNQDVVFDVRPVDVDGQYLARAFFPNDQRPARNVLIDESSFQLNPAGKLQLVGILRHELGHALGWRHEHTRPESGQCFEDAGWRPLTGYDRFSVMHYPQCNGGGDWSLALTAADKAGAACVYGKGSDQTVDLGPCLNNPPAAPVAGTQKTETFTAQAIAAGERKHYGPFATQPGSIVSIAMTPSGANAGDPDLYVRYVDKPQLRRWVCRPYLSGADETCELEVPSNRDRVYVMVHGFGAGIYDLRVVTVP